MAYYDDLVTKYAQDMTQYNTDQENYSKWLYASPTNALTGEGAPSQGVKPGPLPTWYPEGTDPFAASIGPQLFPYINQDYLYSKVGKDPQQTGWGGDSGVYSWTDQGLLKVGQNTERGGPGAFVPGYYGPITPPVPEEISGMVNMPQDYNPMTGQPYSKKTWDILTGPIASQAYPGTSGFNQVVGNILPPVVKIGATALASYANPLLGAGVGALMNTPASVENRNWAPVIAGAVAGYGAGGVLGKLGEVAGLGTTAAQTGANLGTEAAAGSWYSGIADTASNWYTGAKDYISNWYTPDTYGGIESGYGFENQYGNAGDWLTGGGNVDDYFGDLLTDAQQAELQGLWNPGGNAGDSSWSLSDIPGKSYITKLLGGNPDSPSGGGSNLGLLAALLGGGTASLVGANAQRQANSDLTRENLANWQQYAFPNADKMSAMRSKGISDINRRYANSADQISEQMAARGLSGNILGAGLGENERAKNRDFANLSKDLTSFANTPYSAPPVTTQPSVSGIQQIADMAKGISGTYAGYDFAKGMYGNQGNSELALLLRLLQGGA
jgi:hypothetical protein